MARLVPIGVRDLTKKRVFGVNAEKTLCFWAKRLTPSKSLNTVVSAKTGRSAS